MTVDPDKAYTNTMAPRVIKGRVMIGVAGGEYGVRGYISAYDAETGALAWRFFAGGHLADISSLKRSKLSPCTRGPMSGPHQRVLTNLFAAI